METKENKDNILAQSNIHGEGGGRVDGQGGGVARQGINKSKRIEVWSIL